MPVQQLQSSPSSRAAADARAVHPGGASGPGLSATEANARLRRHGPNALGFAPRGARMRAGARRLANPLVLVLLFAGAVAAATGQGFSAGMIATVVVLSIAIDFWQAGRADRAAAALAARIAPTTRVVRDGREQVLPVADVVPGDLVRLAAGSLVPADGQLLESEHLFVQQSLLTGEPFPVGKQASRGGEAAMVFMGSSVVSGTATMLVRQTGMSTRMGGMARLLQADRSDVALDIDLRRFGNLVLRLATGLVLVVLLANGWLGRPWLDNFLFALALAVGITPELLPMVISVSLARGALRLSQQHVIVRHMAAIHSLGGMDVLCTDKTGTLTQARIAMVRHVGLDGRDSALVTEIAFLNSRFETGIRTPLEDAILALPGVDTAGWRKLGELPFDFERRRASVVLQRGEQRRLCMKGAAADVLACCDRWCSPQGTAALDDAARARALQTLAGLEGAGMRVLGVAWSDGAPAEGEAIREEGLVFAGFAAFVDPPRPDARAALEDLRARGVRVVVLTGDSEAVTRHVCEAIGQPCGRVMLGDEVAALGAAALARRARQVDAFCRLDPVQKVRVIEALRKAGHVVGFLGDGINDGPALHAADVGISVDHAAEAARAAADLLLLRRGLGVLRAAVLEGRRTFANSRKYILLGTSSNFGNMASMACAVLLLPFLPMLPVQVLLNNLLYEVASMALPLDRVDEEDLARPQRWDMGLVRRFMFLFGPLSSLFDLATFAVLLLVLQLQADAFRAAWFTESLLTQTLAMAVIRTRGAALASAPHPAVLAAAGGVLAVALVLPWTGAAGWFFLQPLDAATYALVALLTAAYLVVLEAAKRAFWRRQGTARARLDLDHGTQPRRRHHADATLTRRTP